MLQPVGNQVLDRNDLELVLLGKGNELWQALDRAVIVDHLRQHTGRLKPRKGRQINRRLGMARARQNPAFPRNQRKNVARPDEIRSVRIAASERPDGVGALLGGDAGGHADLVIDRNGKRRAERIDIVGNHGVEMQRRGAWGRHRHADDAARMTDHEGELFGGGLGGGHDQVALVLAIGVVDHHHEFARRNRRNRRFNRVQRHRSCPLCRTRYISPRQHRRNATNDHHAVRAICLFSRD